MYVGGVCIAMTGEKKMHVISLREEAATDDLCTFVTAFY
jgi:hypothetical protein